MNLPLQGYGTELSSLLALVLIFDKIIFPLWRNWREHKKITLRTQKIVVPNNPNSKPGTGKECIKHGKKLTELNIEIKNIKEDIVEIKENNREDHEKIFDKIDKIKDKRR